MKYQVLKPFKVKITDEEMDIHPGQIVILPRDKAIRLLNEGKIKPLERLAIKAWSEILQTHLWIVYDLEDIETLRKEISKDPIYAISEISQLKGLTKDSLREINQVKEIFPMSIVEEIIKKDLKE